MITVIFLSTVTFYCSALSGLCLFLPKCYCQRWVKLLVLKYQNSPRILEELEHETWSVNTESHHFRNGVEQHDTFSWAEARITLLLSSVQVTPKQCLPSQSRLYTDNHHSCPFQSAEIPHAEFLVNSYTFPVFFLNFALCFLVLFNVYLLVCVLWRNLLSEEMMTYCQWVFPFLTTQEFSSMYRL